MNDIDLSQLTLRFNKDGAEKAEGNDGRDLSEIDGELTVAHQGLLFFEAKIISLNIDRGTP